MNSLLYKNITDKINLSRDDFEKFAALTKVKTLKKNEFFLREGNSAKYLAFITSGILYSYSVDQKGEKHVIQIALKNHWISDLSSFISSNTSNYNIQAIEASEILLISKTNFEKACKKIPVFERFFRLLIQNAYVNSQSRISRIYANTAEERYKKLLESNPTIIQKISQHYIASYLGIKPQSLSRIRKKLFTK